MGFFFAKKERKIEKSRVKMEKNTKGFGKQNFNFFFAKSVNR